jgi:hypothetical protein
MLIPSHSRVHTVPGLLGCDLQALQQQPSLNQDLQTVRQETDSFNAINSIKKKM